MDLKIASQIPEADEVVDEGIAVDVILAEPEPKKSDKSGDGAGGDGEQVEVPKLVDDPAAFTAQLEELGLKPVEQFVYDKADRNTLIATKPKEGTKLDPGSEVILVISAGFPELTFDNGSDILRSEGATSVPLDPIAEAEPGQSLTQPTWSPDGKRVAYVNSAAPNTDGTIFLADLNDPSADPSPITSDGTLFSNPGWAPTSRKDLLALTQVNSSSRDLCLGKLAISGLRLQCKSTPGLTIAGPLVWGPSGKALFAFATKPSGVFGIVRFKSKKAFSAETKNWSDGRFVTDVGTPGQGVIAISISPTDLQLAMVANFGSGIFQLFITEPGDFLMTNAAKLPIRACTVDWREDGEQLVVVQANNCLGQPLGSVVATDTQGEIDGKPFTTTGNRPRFQPLELSGD